MILPLWSRSQTLVNDQPSADVMTTAERVIRRGRRCEPRAVQIRARDDRSAIPANTVTICWYRCCANRRHLDAGRLLWSKGRPVCAQIPAMADAHRRSDAWPSSDRARSATLIRNGRVEIPQRPWRVLHATKDLSIAWCVTLPPALGHRAATAGALPASPTGTVKRHHGRTGGGFFAAVFKFHCREPGSGRRLRASGQGRRLPTGDEGTLCFRNGRTKIWLHERSNPIPSSEDMPALRPASGREILAVLLETLCGH